MTPVCVCLNMCAKTLEFICVCAHVHICVYVCGCVLVFVCVCCTAAVHPLWKHEAMCTVLFAKQWHPSWVHCTGFTAWEGPSQLREVTCATQEILPTPLCLFQWWSAGVDRELLGLDALQPKQANDQLGHMCVRLQDSEPWVGYLQRDSGRSSTPGSVMQRIFHELVALGRQEFQTGFVEQVRG